MGFEKGKSGNPKGRPKMSDDERRQREEFKRLLKNSTVDALECIIQIAHDKHNKDRFNACKFIIEKAFGTNAVFLTNTKETEHTVIEIIPKGWVDPEWLAIEDEEEW